MTERKGGITEKGISLIGMPASGKATIGRILANNMQFVHVDMDRWMEVHEGNQTTAEIQARHGRAYILDLEEQCVEAHDLRRTVLSTSGSIIYTKSLDRIRSLTHIVMLDVTLDELEQRLAYDTDNSRGIVGLQPGGLATLYEERRPLYESWAEVAIPCAGKLPDQIATEIGDWYAKVEQMR